ncbi:serine beta-lactamase-like protein LACTB, mitochondrial [Penaeus chinensis]|uniref:serine beta-lactamase-like protein LACTB, mitochondrial n=1 Tax=Penaeus chinensis TaxID=139456 RepID=UPI001FB85565|nr:serine beta-lactamase-like protein LACTB, mitochondrial [Penaeus chinensis]
MLCNFSRLKPVSCRALWFQQKGLGRLISSPTLYKHHQQICYKHEIAGKFLVSDNGKNYRRGREQHDSRFRHNNMVNLLASLVGTATVISIGTALCESQEEKKDILPNDDKHHPQGKDVVATELPEKSEDTSEEQRPKGNDEEQNIQATSDEVQGDRKSRIEEAVKQSRKLLKRRMIEAGAPGLTVAVSVNGETFWEDGLGFADLENNVRCTPRTVMRIASISKSLTMTAVAKLWEEGKLDLDAPVQKYIPGFPIKKFEGEEVTITTRHLLSHQSGIRHYALKDPNKKEKKEKNDSTGGKKGVESKGEGESGETKKKDEEVGEKKGKTKQAKDDSGEKALAEKAPSKVQGKESNESSESSQSVVETKKAELEKLLKGKANKKRKSKKKEEEENEFDLQEYYIKEKFESIEEALKLFQDDELFFKPGTGYLYTTHGWTVVSGVVEGAAGKPFTKVIAQLFHELGLENTYLDVYTPIIYNRSKFYTRDKHGRLQNAPYVDNSYKWAGGGFLSTVQDLNKFGNAMLYSSQHQSEEGLPGYLKWKTMKELWTPVSGPNPSSGYGLGWGAVEDSIKCAFCHESRQCASHSGGAIGASSILLILPQSGVLKEDGEGKLPKGVVVSVICNMQSVALRKVALEIAKIFEKV